MSSLLLGIRGFRLSTPLSELPLETLGYLLMGVALLVVLRMTWVWQSRIWSRLGPWFAYGRVARGVGLTIGERWCLWRIARSLKMVTPITFLLSESTMRYHAKQYLSELPPRHVDGEKQLLDSIRKRLFSS